MVADRLGDLLRARASRAAQDRHRSVAIEQRRQTVEITS
jgi:hypothetical protein